ncbi:FAD-dependent oxidoreductase [Pseudoclavibacter chungangensis]|uniref:FAD-dependent oxidoreductase n=1 Tax=Pseudoclavibacter chungangensis TaxID=587635 RepID=A0A7J5BWY1_9MICO|nr:FAD-dependent oxidoreductase [Pseudoclavibacter chungangensis]KAB1658000.1 FAD-dependent oxidoreductase [Pseudoclavibacter chungangensis]NYJ65838.1 glycine/D-amino acid oxidase-like deaminating enzyme [Pseudoclavibacter chungangensis]
MSETSASTGTDTTREHGRVHRSYWIDRAPARRPQSALTADITADLLVVGGGYTGLWTALHAKERDPGARVVLLEGTTIGHAASGRNGGFIDPSLTHGLSNGVSRWPDEIDELVALGVENYEGMHADIERHGIDCDWREGGMVTFARNAWESDALREGRDECLEHGEEAEYIGPGGVGALTRSPAFVAALRQPRMATVDPYRLAIGLLDACLAAGVEVHESTVVAGIDHRGRGTVRARTATGASVRAERVALATNAYPALLRRLALTTVPVYDYALMTEPLTDEQFASIGWTGDEGLADAGNQFHYFRKSDDGRILWGGYDAIYHYGSRRSEHLTQRAATFETLERNFRDTYPQLADVRFTHQWGGMIDSSTRFCLTAGTAARGRIAYALGYTGLGVAATRFGADAMLDLLAGESTRRTRCALVAAGSLPFPPEPARAIGVNLTRWSMAAEDRTGKRNLWLKAMDAVGLGFDS